LCIVFSVQVATEFTSAAAPRTVLHAAIVSAPPIRTAVTSFRTMIAPLFCLWNDHGRCYGLLSSDLTMAVVHRVLGAVRDRIDVSRGAADRVASCQDQSGTDQGYRRDFLEHDDPLLV
jgi:hypothetical protein